MTDTPHLALPLLAAAQSQKHVTVNEALTMLDAIVQLAVLDRDLTAPPSSPTEGDRYIVASGATGDWAGHDLAIARWSDGAWAFDAPQSGWLAYVLDENALIVWTGSAWDSAISTITSLQNLALLGLGTIADTTNPLSAKINGALFAAKTAAEGGSGDLRYTLSKEAAGHSLSFLFQDNFSGRAELGLTGDDDFHVKVSPDGSSWQEAMKIVASTGQIQLLAGGLLGGGRLKAITALTAASGTWTRASGIRYALVFCIGAGGGGGGAQGTASNGACGAGGAAGGLAIRFLDVTAISSVSYTVGAGGAGGSTSGGNGSAGGDSTFGSYATGGGGGGGTGQTAGTWAAIVAGGIGGSASSGDLNLQGGAGAPGIRLDYQNGISGNGAPAALFGGGGRGQVGNTGGQQGIARGDGGSGGVVANSATGQAGGDGADGLIWVWEFE